MSTTAFRGAWTEAEVDAFLREVTIPVRLATRRPDGSPWLVTLWYRYRDGAFECATGANADVVRFLRGDPEVAFDVSTNRPPYRGVRGNGTASLSPDRGKATLRDLIERYLDGTDSPLAERLLDDDREEVRIRVEPAVIHSWDYTERMSAPRSDERGDGEGGSGAGDDGSGPGDGGDANDEAG
ncbi:pyridoxamine 5'-phosphate oxidase family protein [Candidatus Halobonum tyrrellensis]|uniref:Pyridoxamine 5'-phosphate oxidase-related FMN-binding protein n=1 Tax=Candidatus Halobonum tyrrellensis G22 TaxID=1324957 RepID=V4HBK6_9EURY|nr:pyridoxamine 5'-phosphate oxidase family protein [Candidatus Halobonum tyrrellensis]ESP87428.1 pyridoxamine 5'-phosphate oxidase-related FMN-binding protein [Candidatus Halobonum tyrrellensis G22]